MRDARVGSEVLGFEQSRYSLLQIQPSSVDHSGGNLFATDLKEKVRHLGKILFSQTPELYHKVPAIVTLHRTGYTTLTPAKDFSLGDNDCELSRRSGSFLRFFLCTRLTLLIHVGFRNPYGQGSHSGDHAHTFRDGNGAAGIEDIE